MRGIGAGSRQTTRQYLCCRPGLPRRFRSLRSVPIDPSVAWMRRYGSTGHRLLLSIRDQAQCDLTQIVYSTYVTDRGARRRRQSRWMLKETWCSPEPRTRRIIPRLPMHSSRLHRQRSVAAEYLFWACLISPRPAIHNETDATGTGLIYSTFSAEHRPTPSHSRQSRVVGSTVGPGPIRRFSGLEAFPSQCLPQTFETRLSLDGSSITAAACCPAACWRIIRPRACCWRGLARSHQLRSGRSADSHTASWMRLIRSR